MKIMNAAQEAEYTKLILAGEPLSKKDQTKLIDDSKNTQKKDDINTIPSDEDWTE